jgi:hypothetical protein|tara:strand:+ start:353 stop:529 length:177 start_codon:yes stop_codon:yes gene_type:complete
MRTPGATMHKKSKQDLLNEIEILQGISLALYRALEKTPQTTASKLAIDDLIQYITEKL